MTFQDKKKLLNTFVIVYLLVFVVFNWSEVSWLFNYKFLSKAISSISLKNNQQVLSNSDSGEQIRENSLNIPKIGISVPLIIGRSSNEIDLEKDLKKGAVYFPDSVFPGQKGQTIVLGHSAPLGWPKVNYDWIFNNLNSLEQGNSVSLYFNNEKYVYHVKTKIFLNKGEDIPKDLTNNHNVLVLVSCWPPGKDSKRIAVQAELINNYGIGFRR